MELTGTTPWDARECPSRSSGTQHVSLRTGNPAMERHDLAEVREQSERPPHTSSYTS